VASFSRQTTTTGGTLGKLTQLPGSAACVSETGAGGCADGIGLDGASGVAVSPTGKGVYVSSQLSDAVAAFSRQTTTTGGTLGKLTQLAGSAGCVSESGAGCTNGVALDGAFGIALSADGKSAYVPSVLSSGVAVFSRTP
jgi:DNA-binding beta-propeller fold protein YncE